MKAIRMFVATLAISSLIGIASPAFATDEPATKEDIRLLIAQMDKRFDAMQSQMDKRFEQIDKRFEFIQTLLLALFGATLGVPFWIEHQRKQRSQTEINLLRELERLLTAMREAAVHNPQFKELLTSARLL